MKYRASYGTGSRPNNESRTQIHKKRRATSLLSKHKSHPSVGYYHSYSDHLYYNRPYSTPAEAYNAAKWTMNIPPRWVDNLPPSHANVKDYVRIANAQRVALGLDGSATASVKSEMPDRGIRVKQETSPRRSNSSANGAHIKEQMHGHDYEPAKQEDHKFSVKEEQATGTTRVCEKGKELSEEWMSWVEWDLAVDQAAWQLSLDNSLRGAAAKK